MTIEVGPGNTDPTPVDATGQRRTRLFLVFTTVTSAAIIGVLAYVTFAHHPAPPIGPMVGISGNDALPATLIAGQHYTATFTFTLGPSWPSAAPGSAEPVTALAFMTAAADTGPACSQAFLAAGNATRKFECAFTAPTAPGPVELTLHLDSTSGSPDRNITQKFAHTVSAQ